MQSINYDNIAKIYAQNRPANSHVVDELLRGCTLDSASKVLEVGCGTGSHIQILTRVADCQGWGVDPSQGMMQQSIKSGKIRFLPGTAEKLPFEDKYFDFLFSVDVIHHLRSTIAYFHEAFRVLKPGGAICTVTDSERNIKDRKPLSQYWPSSTVTDLKRYPPISILKAQIKDAGFIDIDEKDIQSTDPIMDITPYREKAFSCLRLISRDDFLRGLQRLEEDFKAGPIQRLSIYTSLWGHANKS